MKIYDTKEKQKASNFILAKTKMAPPGWCDRIGIILEKLKLLTELLGF